MDLRTTFRWVACQMDLTFSASYQRMLLVAMHWVLSSLTDMLRMNRFSDESNKSNKIVQTLVQRALRWIVLAHDPT